MDVDGAAAVLLHHRGGGAETVERLLADRGEDLEVMGEAAERMAVICDMRMGPDIRAFALRPSEFLARNFRATPFITEDIGKMIERHRNLEDVYCFSTDFPHPEGGTNPLGVMSESIERLGSATLEKFLVTNSELLMPA